MGEQCENAAVLAKHGRITGTGNSPHFMFIAQVWVVSFFLVQYKSQSKKE